VLAAVTVDRCRVELQEVPEPEPAAGEALLRIGAVGLCGTDLHMWAGERSGVGFPLRQGHEIGAVHKQWKDGFFVVPGLRMNGNHGDQKRVVTPRQARDDGACVLVVGRPISRAEDPLAAARAIEATL